MRTRMLLIASSLVLALSGRAGAACGLPSTDGPDPKTMDCLIMLRTAVELDSCARCVCDVDDSGVVTATDALLCLRKAVGQSVALDCPECSGGACPVSVQWTTVPRYGEPCVNNGDCEVGSCHQASGRCRSATRVDLGWSGRAHEADLLEGLPQRALVDCDGGGGDCGSCDVLGVDPSSGACRCSNDSSRACDAPFVLDGDDCPACFAGAYVGNSCAVNADCDGGACTRRCTNDRSKTCTKNADCPGSTCDGTDRCETGKTCVVEADCVGTCTTGSLCQCYDGAPTPVAAGTTPFCVVPRLAGEPGGGVDPDNGVSSVTKDLRLLVYAGASPSSPCPVCGGTCPSDGGKDCSADADCAAGACDLDDAAGDGVKGGTCLGGARDGQPCDVVASSYSLPARGGDEGGAGYSLDCLPTAGTNLTGGGLAVVVTESTGTDNLAFQAECADVASANACTDGLCSAGGGASGSCTTGPDDRFCDIALQASGRGVFACQTNQDCEAGDTGFPEASTCSVVQRRSCFPTTIVATGDADDRFPTSAAVFCVPATANSNFNEAVGLPGPARLARQSEMRSFCPGGGQYQAGAGGCEP